MNKNIAIGRAVLQGARLGLLAAAGFVLGVLPSCRQEPDAIFDKSSSERVDALTTELQKTLTASSTGWVLEYYPHTQLLYGGYPVTMTFGAKNEVLMASDAPVKGHSTAEVKSNYHLKSDKMVSLSFDTYSSPLHLFSDPDKVLRGWRREELRGRL